jgi:hypothetical protein
MWLYIVLCAVTFLLMTAGFWLRLFGLKYGASIWKRW